MFIVALFLPLISTAFAWWWIEMDPIIFSSTKYYLLPFGTISNSANDNIVEIDDSSIVIISVFVIISAIMMIFGGIRGSKAIGGLGVIIGAFALIAFLFAIGNVEEIQNLFLGTEPSNYLFGSEKRWLDTVELTWQLGTGYIIAWVGLVSSFFGLASRR